MGHSSPVSSTQAGCHGLLGPFQRTLFQTRATARVGGRSSAHRSIRLAHHCPACAPRRWRSAEAVIKGRVRRRGHLITETVNHESSMVYGGLGGTLACDDPHVIVRAYAPNIADRPRYRQNGAARAARPPSSLWFKPRSRTAGSRRPLVWRGLSGPYGRHRQSSSVRHVAGVWPALR